MAGKDQQKRKDRWNYFAWGVLTFLILLHITVNYIVLGQDNVFFETDVASNYIATIKLLTEFPQENLAGKIALFGTRAHDFFTPFFLSVGALFLALFGVGQDVAVMVNALFIPVLILSTYFLGKRLMNREAGLAAAILISFFPGAFSMSRTYQRYFPLIAMITLSVLLLLESKNMSKRKESAVLGAVLGLTALTHTPFSLFLIGPITIEVIVPLVKAVRARKGPEVRTMLLNILLAGIIFAAIAAPWYIFHAGNYLEYTGGFIPHSLFDIKQYRPEVSLTDFTRFVRIMESLSFKPVWYVFYGAFAYLMLVHKRHRFLLTSWLLGLYIGFIILSLSHDSYHLLRNQTPALPAAALILALFLTDIPTLLRNKFTPHKKSMAELIPLFILVIEVPLFFYLTFNGSGDLTAPFGVLNGRWRNFMSDTHGRMSPYRHTFNLEEVADEFEAELASRDEVPLIFIFNPYGRITDGLIRTELYSRKGLHQLQFDTTHCIGEFNIEGGSRDVINANRAAFLDNRTCQERFKDSDYAVIETFKHDIEDNLQLMAVETVTTSSVAREIQSEDFMMLAQQIKRDLGSYTLLRELTFEENSDRPVQWFSELGIPEPIPEEFEWMNESTWIVKLR